MDRRTFLGAGLALLVGCGTDRDASAPTTSASTSSTAASTTSTAPPSSSLSVTTTSTSATSTTTTTGIAPPRTLGELADRLRGPLLLPTDSGYDDARRLFDPEFDPVLPAAVVRVADAADVQRCVEFAAAAGMPITARSGGHSYIGASTVADGLVVDLRSLASVTVDGTGPIGPAATIGAGARLIDVYDGLASAGRALPAGTCPTVGIGGLTLGGGVGVTARAWGLTCDNLLGADVVTADGRLVRASAEDHPDLHWALQGGGGGLAGIVTGFRFATHPAVDVVTFVLRWDAAAAADVIPAWLSWASGGPDELWSNCVFGQEPDLRLRCVGAFLGPEAEAQAQIDRLAAAAGTQPTARSVRTRTFGEAMAFMAGCSERTVEQCRVDEGDGRGELSRVAFAAKSAYLDRVPDDAGMAELVAAFDRDAAPAGAASVVAIIDGNGGAIGRVPTDATAFPHRSSLASIQYYAGWSRAEAAAPTTQWLRDVHDRFAPWTTGGAYVNYIDPDLDVASGTAGRAYYGANADRLSAIKAAWDPDRVFDVGSTLAR